MNESDTSSGSGDVAKRQWAQWLFGCLCALFLLGTIFNHFAASVLLLAATVVVVPPLGRALISANDSVKRSAQWLASKWVRWPVSLTLFLLATSLVGQSMQVELQRVKAEEESFVLSQAEPLAQSGDVEGAWALLEPLESPSSIELRHLKQRVEAEYVAMMVSQAIEESRRFAAEDNYEQAVAILEPFAASAAEDVAPLLNEFRTRFQDKQEADLLREFGVLSNDDIDQKIVVYGQLVALREGNEEFAAQLLHLRHARAIAERNSSSQDADRREFRDWAVFCRDGGRSCFLRTSLPDGGMFDVKPAATMSDMLINGPRGARWVMTCDGVTTEIASGYVGWEGLGSYATQSVSPALRRAAYCELSVENEATVRVSAVGFSDALRFAQGQMNPPTTSQGSGRASASRSMTVSIESGRAGQVIVIQSDAVCRSIQQIFQRLRAVELGRYGSAFPPGPPECVDPPAGARMQATGRRTAYTFEGSSNPLWLVEVRYRGETRWVLKSMIQF